MTYKFIKIIFENRIFQHEQTVEMPANNLAFIIKKPYLII